MLYAFNIYDLTLNSFCICHFRYIYEIRFGSCCSSILLFSYLCMLFFCTLYCHRKQTILSHKCMFTQINSRLIVNSNVTLRVKIECVNWEKNDMLDSHWWITDCPDTDRHLLFLGSWSELISKLSWSILHLALNISIIALFSNWYECLLSFFLLEQHKDKGLIVVFLHHNQLYAGERLVLLKLITLLNAGDLPNVHFLRLMPCIIFDWVHL